MTNLTTLKKPDIKISVRQTFGIDTEMEVDAFSNKNEFVPKIDQDYKFDRDTTLAVLSGFAFNKKWNYFSDMNDQEIEYFIKSDLTWHKSTKS